MRLPFRSAILVLAVAACSEGGGSNALSTDSGYENDAAAEAALGMEPANGSAAENGAAAENLVQ